MGKHRNQAGAITNYSDTPTLLSKLAKLFQPSHVPWDMSKFGNQGLESRVRLIAERCSTQEHCTSELLRYYDIS